MEKQNIDVLRNIYCNLYTYCASISMYVCIRIRTELRKIRPLKGNSEIGRELHHIKVEYSEYYWMEYILRILMDTKGILRSRSHSRKCKLKYKFILKYEFVPVEVN